VAAFARGRFGNPSALVPCPFMDRQKVGVGAAVVAVLLSVSVLLLIQHADRSRAGRGPPPRTSTTTTAPVLTFVPPRPPSGTPPTPSTSSPSSLDNSALALPAGGYASLRGEPPVTWKISGACQTAGTAYACHVVVAASNGLQSAGYVGIYLYTQYGHVCGERLPLAHGSVTASGQCPFRPVSSRVVYSVSPLASDGTNLATGTVPFS
jgi:hypothetical protein